MFLKSKKKCYLTVTQNESLLYEGLWNELPLTEEIILEKSIEFFNDREPCAIHRSAVHMRLLAELEQLFSSPDFHNRFCAYTGFPADCKYSFSEK